LTKLLPCQEMVAHRIHSSQPFIILEMSHLSQTSHYYYTSWNIQVYKLSHCYHLTLLMYSFNKYS
jgi:hypothetical protein